MEQSPTPIGFLKKIVCASETKRFSVVISQISEVTSHKTPQLYHVQPQAYLKIMISYCVWIWTMGRFYLTKIPIRFYPTPFTNYFRRISQSNYFAPSHITQHIQTKYHSNFIKFEKLEKFSLLIHFYNDNKSVIDTSSFEIDIKSNQKNGTDCLSLCNI